MVSLLRFVRCLSVCGLFVEVCSLSRCPRSLCRGLVVCVLVVRGLSVRGPVVCGLVVRLSLYSWSLSLCRGCSLYPWSLCVRGLFVPGLSVSAVFTVASFFVVTWSLVSLYSWSLCTCGRSVRGLLVCGLSLSVCGPFVSVVSLCSVVSLYSLVVSLVVSWFLCTRSPCCDLCCSVPFPCVVCLELKDFNN